MSHRRGRSTSMPLLAITGQMSPNTPKGATRMMPRMMAMHTSDMALQMSMTGLAFFPAAIMPKPNTTAMTMTCSIVASAMGWKKFDGNIFTIVSMSDGGSVAS